MSAFIPSRTEEQHQRITANYMPSGRAMEAKNIAGKVMYKKLNALSKGFSRIENAINDFLNGIVITKSADMVEEWEKCLGIPDESTIASGTREERRRYCVFKLSAEGMATKSELEWLLSVYGIAATVYPGLYFYNNYNPDVGTFSSVKEARFTIVFGVDMLSSEPEVANGNFPITFPWTFEESRIGIAQAFMREVIQANVNARWFYEGDIVQDTIDSADIWQDSISETDIIQDV